MSNRPDYRSQPPRVAETTPDAPNQRPNRLENPTFQLSPEANSLHLATETPSSSTRVPAPVTRAHPEPWTRAPAGYTRFTGMTGIPATIAPCRRSDPSTSKPPNPIPGYRLLSLPADHTGLPGMTGSRLLSLPAGLCPVPGKDAPSQELCRQFQRMRDYICKMKQGTSYDRGNTTCSPPGGGE